MEAARHTRQGCNSFRTSCKRVRARARWLALVWHEPLGSNGATNDHPCLEHSNKPGNSPDTGRCRPYAEDLFCVL